MCGHKAPPPESRTDLQHSLGFRALLNTGLLLKAQSLPLRWTLFAIIPNQKTGKYRHGTEWAYCVPDRRPHCYSPSS